MLLLREYWLFCNTEGWALSCPFFGLLRKRQNKQNHTENNWTVIVSSLTELNQLGSIQFVNYPSQLVSFTYSTVWRGSILVIFKTVLIFNWVRPLVILPTAPMYQLMIKIQSSSVRKSKVHFFVYVLTFWFKTVVPHLYSIRFGRDEPLMNQFSKLLYQFSSLSFINRPMNIPINAQFDTWASFIFFPI